MSTKITRAIRKSTVGEFPRTFSSMLEYVPASAMAKLSSTEIAELVDAFWSCAQKSKYIAELELREAA